MGWTAADWMEGAGCCVVDTYMPPILLDLNDWSETAASCYVESWKRPPVSTTDVAEEASVSPRCHPGMDSPVSRKGQYVAKGAVPAAHSLSCRASVKHQPQRCAAVPASAKQETAEEVPGAKEAAGRSQQPKTHCVDFLVLGSGVAGLRYALAVAEHGRVAVVTKSIPEESNTLWAQGGISAVLDPEDSVENHVQDTLVAGAFLCDEAAVRVVCSEGPTRVLELMDMGAKFDRTQDGRVHLTREGGHSHHRIVHTADITGREVETTLLGAVQSHANIEIFPMHFAVDLLTMEEDGQRTCWGIDALDLEKGEVVRFLAGATMLASGGAGHVYPNSTNPTVATGDGIAMAYRAGALISNMEFMQFHPTALAEAGLPAGFHRQPRDSAFLITEAVRGSGGLLYNQAMERFMPSYDPRAELAPRDVVARAIDDQLKTRGEKWVWLDISHASAAEIASHFPTIAAECAKAGIDITKQPIPVVPAMHYTCGGVVAGLDGATTVQGLFACGEVSCTGLHGANRLASNSLLEGLVFAERAVQPSVEVALAEGRGAALRRVAERGVWPGAAAAEGVLTDAQVKEVAAVAAQMRRQLQDVMWEYVGIVRSDARLAKAQAEIDCLRKTALTRLNDAGWKGASMASREVGELQNLLDVAALVVDCAARRKESRGLHYTLDYPDLVESERHPSLVLPA